MIKIHNLISGEHYKVEDTVKNIEKIYALDIINQNSKSPEYWLSELDNNGNYIYKEDGITKNTIHLYKDQLDFYIFRKK